MNPLSRWRIRRRIVREAVETYRAVRIARRFFESGTGRRANRISQAASRPPQLVEDWRRGLRR